MYNENSKTKFTEEIKNVGGRPQPCVAEGGDCHPLNSVDINGDGLVDWVQSYRNPQGGLHRDVWLN
ncbi:MAG: hypothetical protein ABUK01_18995, partial [Leptospirales bacterium]